jgi:hypothetical protein
VVARRSAVVESFFSSLKTELPLPAEPVAAVEEARAQLFRYLDAA